MCHILCYSISDIYLYMFYKFFKTKLFYYFKKYFLPSAYQNDHCVLRVNMFQKSIPTSILVRVAKVKFYP